MLVSPFTHVIGLFGAFTVVVCTADVGLIVLTTGVRVVVAVLSAGTLGTVMTTTLGVMNSAVVLVVAVVTNMLQFSCSFFAIFLAALH